MFTGIIRHVGAVRQIRPSAGGKRLTVDLGPLAEGLRVGESVAVSGACLTASAIGGAEVDFDVVAETLSKTTLGDLHVASRVNLERSLRLSDALDGHLVQGHVDGVAKVRTVRGDGRHVIELAAAKDLTGQMAPKGSICIDGVSLTLVDVSQAAFSVALIPTTLAETTLGELVVGAKVNVETDVIAKYVLMHLRRLGQPSGGELTMEKLSNAGFVD